MIHGGLSFLIFLFPYSFLLSYYFLSSYSSFFLSSFLLSICLSNFIFPLFFPPFYFSSFLPFFFSYFLLFFFSNSLFSLFPFSLFSSCLFSSCSPREIKCYLESLEDCSWVYLVNYKTGVLLFFLLHFQNLLFSFLLLIHGDKSVFWAHHQNFLYLGFTAIGGFSIHKGHPPFSPYIYLGYFVCLCVIVCVCHNLCRNALLFF